MDENSLYINMSRRKVREAQWLKGAGGCYYIVGSLDPAIKLRNGG